MLCVLLAAFLLPPLAAQDAADIIRKSLERDANNYQRAKDYTYIARQEEREFDKSGKVKIGGQRDLRYLHPGRAPL